MGMFDYVNYEDECGVCGAKIREFQSKDGDCLLAMVEPSSVDIFYAICSSCGAWHDYVTNRGITLNGIHRTVTAKGH